MIVQHAHRHHRMANRADALASLWELAARVQDEQRYPITFADVSTAAALKGEQARAELRAIRERIAGPEA